MPYQNNNNRVMPDAAKNITLQPQAAPVDKIISYQPNLDSAKKTAATAEALSKMGQGLVDIAPIWERQAEEAVIEAEMETEKAGKNKSEWADVSRNVRGMAKFNPYLKDAFKNSQARDITEGGMLEMLTIQSAEQLSPENYIKKLKEIETKTATALQESGLQPKDYINHLMMVHDTLENAKSTQFEANAKYEYKVGLIKLGSDVYEQLSAASFNTKDKYTAYKTTLNNFINQKTADGIPEMDLAAVLVDGLKNYITTNSDKINSAQLGQVVKDLQINGKDITDILPEYELTRIIKEARRANYDDKALDYQIKELDIKVNTNNAQADLFDYLVKNKNAPAQQKEQFLVNTIQKYGVQENGFGLLGALVQGQTTLKHLSATQTDEELHKQLWYKASIGELDGNAVGNAVLNNQLSIPDAQALTVLINKEKSEEIKRVENHLKEIDKQYLKKTGGYYTRDSKRRTQIQRDVITLKGDYEQGKLSYEEFNNHLSSLKAAVNKENNYKAKADDLSTLIGYVSISKAQYAAVDYEKDLVAIKRMGLTHYKGAADKSVSIVSLPAAYRAASNGSHKGYDLGGAGVKLGNYVYPPMDGTVVYSGNAGTAGNMVLVKCSNNKYVKYMHLSGNQLPKVGQKVSRNQPVGIVGATGRVLNKSVGSLHVEFSDTNREWIPANQFFNS